MNAFLLFYVTFPDEIIAKEICEIVINERLAACSNSMPITSSYWWDTKIQNDNEIAVILKTTKEKAKELSKRIEDLHPYDVPCVIHFEVSANEAYYNWIKAEVS